MPFNRIAVYGHRGWASSKIVESLAASGAYIRFLHRNGSDISGLPRNIDTVEVDLTDHKSLAASLKDIDILIDRDPFVCSIEACVQDDDQGNLIKVNRDKIEVDQAAQKVQAPVTLVLPGNFAEFALNTPAMGVDSADNKILFTGESKDQAVNLCTRSYVTAAYASIFASTKVDEVKNRVIGLSELQPTGNKVLEALSKNFNTPPAPGLVPTTLVSQQIRQLLEEGNPLALPYYCRKIWGTG